MKKSFYFILLLMLGLLVQPEKIIACGSNTETTSCKKQTSKREKKDCCKKDMKHDDCGGKCSHKSCHCISNTSSTATPVSVRVENETFDFVFLTHDFYDFKLSLPSGFYAIWIPPNIS